MRKIKVRDACYRVFEIQRPDGTKNHLYCPNHSVTWLIIGSVCLPMVIVFVLGVSLGSTAYLSNVVFTGCFLTACDQSALITPCDAPDVPCIELSSLPPTATSTMSPSSWSSLSTSTASLSPANTALSSSTATTAIPTKAATSGAPTASTGWAASNSLSTCGELAVASQVPLKCWSIPLEDLWLRINTSQFTPLPLYVTLSGEFSNVSYAYLSPQDRLSDYDSAHSPAFLFGFIIFGIVCFLVLLFLCIAPRYFLLCIRPTTEDNADRWRDVPRRGGLPAVDEADVERRLSRLDSNAQPDEKCAHCQAVNVRTNVVCSKVIDAPADQKCLICWSEFDEDNKEVIALPCSHMFCKKCVGIWLDSHTYCPECSYQLRNGNDTFIDESTPQ